jgi:hypothetical protein
LQIPLLNAFQHDSKIPLPAIPTNKAFNYRGVCGVGSMRFRRGPGRHKEWHSYSD